MTEPNGQLALPLMKLDANVQTPCYAYPGDAGLDLPSAIDAHLEPFERMAVPCGIAIAIPEGYAGLVVPRSGLAAKHGISIVNAPGLVDSGYRGELKVILVNLDAHNAFDIARGDRIAQLVLVAVPEARVIETSELPESQRGTSGFGSSGVKPLA